MGFNSVTIPSPGNNVAAGTLSKPLVFDQNALFGAPYDPGLNVVAGGGIQGAPALVDRNMGRPSRVLQWNVSLQREVVRDLIVEAAFVGNVGVWLDNGSSQGFSNASVGNLINYDAVSPAVLAAHGLGDLTDANTRSLLSSTITSAAAVAAGFKKPYANFPDSGSVLQSLRPFPQYSGIGQFEAPLGKSWYDSLQVKVVKRMSHGLTATMAYTFSKTLDSTTNAGSIYDWSTFKGLSPQYYPHIFSLSVDYTVPGFGPVKRNRIARTLLADWRITSISTHSERPTSGDADLEQFHRQLCVHGIHQNGSGSGRAFVPEGLQLRLHRSDPGNDLESRRLAEPGGRRSGQQRRLLQRFSCAAAAGYLGRHRQGLSRSASACRSASARSSSICST